MVSVTFLMLLLAAAVAGVMLARRGGSLATASSSAEAMPGLGADGQRLLVRWHARAHRWRRDAAVPAVLLASVLSLRLTGGVQFGIVDTAGAVPLIADPVVAGLLALAIGAFGAEVHHLRRGGSGPRRADLTPRRAAELRRPRSRTRRAVLGLLILVAVGLHVWLTPADGGMGSPFAIGTAVAVLLGAELTERRIAARPRPALPAGLDVADQVVRRAAVRSVDDAASGAALLLIAWACLALAGQAPDGRLTDAITALAPVTALIVSIWWAVRSRPSRLLADAQALASEAPA